MLDERISEMDENVGPIDPADTWFEAIVPDVSSATGYSTVKIKIVTIVPAGPTPIEEVFSGVDGSANTVLSQTPSNVFELNLYNGSGQRLRNGVDFTIAADTITWLDTFEATDIVANYKY